MNIEQKELWSKIMDFELDDLTSTLTFSDRLARENGWTLEFSLRAIHEYKKFIFMLCVTEHPLTPSDQVDQVWHLHLIYTQSYWIDLCQNTIFKQIHHGPTKGGKQETDKYNNLYDKTLDLYKILFERNPPDDIWPPNKIRFSDVNFQRINIGKNWIIKKPYFLKNAQPL